jgi:hypothetical protein
MHACEYGSFPVLLSPATSGVAKYWRMKVDRGHASSLRPAAGRTALQHWGRTDIRFRVFPVSAKAGDNITAPPSDYYSVRGHRGRRVALKTT